MNERLQDRIFAGLGIASVVLMLAGVGIGTIGHNRNLTISSTPAEVADAMAKPAGVAMWIGAYIELLSFGCFLAFVIWACSKLGGGLLAQIAKARKQPKLSSSMYAPIHVAAPAGSASACATCAGVLEMVRVRLCPMLPIPTPASISATEPMPKPAKTRSCSRSFIWCSFRVC